MPYKRKYRGRRKRRRFRRKKGKKKTLRLSLRQARSKKINNRSEKIITTVVARLIKEKHPPLIFRRYIFGLFNVNLNEWGPGTPLSWSGNSHHPFQICQTDMSSNVQKGVIVDPDFPLPQENQATQFGRPAGVNFVSPQFRLMGTRIGSKILLHNLRFSLRLVLAPIEEALEFTTVFVKWAFVYFHDTASRLQATELIAEQGMVMPRWGYSAKVDLAEREKTSNTCHLRVIKTGGTVLKYSQDYRTEKFINVSINLKNKVYEYGALDPKVDQTGGPYDSQYGQNVIGPKGFLIFRASCPDSCDAAYKPLMHCVYKVNYENVI